MYSSTRTIDQTIKNVIELRSKNIFTVLYGYFSLIHILYMYTCTYDTYNMHLI